MESSSKDDELTREAPDNIMPIISRFDLMDGDFLPPTFKRVKTSIKSTDKGAVHKNQGKCRRELVPPCLENAAARAFTYGAFKYDNYNWLKEPGIPLSDLIGSMERHLSHIKNREDIDPESGVWHWDHLAADLAMFIHGMIYRPHTDNRPHLIPAQTNNSQYV